MTIVAGNRPLAFALEPRQRLLGVRHFQCRLGRPGAAAVQAMILGTVLLLIASSAAAAYLESWNDDAATHHNWYSWTEGPTWTGSVPMVYQQSGGIGGTPYVRTRPLDELSPWFGGYWPAYTEESTNTGRAAEQRLDLAMDTLIRVYCRTVTDSDLMDGTLYFFIGEWLADTNFSFYYLDIPLTVNLNNWNTRSLLDIEAGNWVVISNRGERTVEDLYNNPQQYGFVILGATNQPTGQLGFDDFYSLATSIALTNLTVSATNLYAATNWITAGDGVVIQTSAVARFLAGDNVRLQPGFKANAGSRFQADINPDL